MVTVDESKCGTCGRCVAFCPREALSVTVRWGHLNIDSERCTDCFGGAYHFEENLPLANKEAILDPTRTTWTRLCIPNCPVSALSVVEEQSG
jgi:ferredoxin